MRKTVPAVLAALAVIFGCQHESEPLAFEPPHAATEASAAPLFDPIDRSTEGKAYYSETERRILLDKAVRSSPNEVVKLITDYASTLDLVEASSSLQRKAGAVLRQSRPESVITGDEHLLIGEMHGYPPDQSRVGTGHLPSIGNGRFFALIYAQKRGLPGEGNAFVADELNLLAERAISAADSDTEMKGETAYWSFVREVFRRRNPQPAGKP